jgi:hypothetical protein
MSRRDFERDRQRQTLAKRGSESVDGGLPIPVAPYRQRPSKADLRKQAEDLFGAAIEITRVFECAPCRFQFRARQAIAPVEPMLCKRCGRPV